MPPIRFYCRGPLSEDLPASPDVYWTGHLGKMRGSVYALILQTFQRLRAVGFPCELTHQLPGDGILVALRKSLPRDYVPPPGVLCVCIRADATFHPFAHLHVVHNRCSVSRWFASTYIAHWPQPGLLPRDPARGDVWENAAFSGDPNCLSREMHGAAWKNLLRELGLRWHFVGPDKWHDYREVDVVVAVRGFDRHRHANKPASKLFNAWHAGVPAVLGRESAYQHERRGPLDYFEARSFSEVVAALRRLQGDPELRRAMRANGFKRAKESAPAVITKRWQDFFERIAIPAHAALGRQRPWQRAAFRWNGALKMKALDWRERLGR